MYGKGIVDIQTERTLKDFNIDISKLHSGSHAKVHVKCTRCNEVFLREFRKLTQLHNCPTKIVREDGTNLKWCNKCFKFLTYDCFNENVARYDGLASHCKSCFNQSEASLKHNANNIFKRKNDIDYWLKRSVSAKKSACIKHGIPFDIDYAYLKQVWNDQNGKCYYFNTNLSFANARLDSAQMERLDGSLGYIKGNVVFASKMANYAKGTATKDDFLEAILAVSASIADNIPRMEVVVNHPDATLPHRSRASDAGYDVTSLINVTIKPGDIVNIDIGLSIVAPFGYYITVEGRSSMYKSGVVPFRGIIDGGYCGPLTVSLMNVGTEPYHINKGDRIAQICTHKLIHTDFTVVSKVSDDYNFRGNLGFGSSGK